MKRISHTIFFLLMLLLMVSPAVMAAPPAQGGYIVVLHNNVDSPAAAMREIIQQVGGRVGFIYEHALKGFSITVPPQPVAALERNPNVKYVATDDIRHAFEQTTPTGIMRIFANTNEHISNDGSDDCRVDVEVAVIDTREDLEHPDLDVMVRVNCTANPVQVRCKSGGDDDH